MVFIKSSVVTICSFLEKIFFFKEVIGAVEERAVYILNFRAKLTETILFWKLAN